MCKNRSMEPTSISSTGDVREYRRLRALALYESGWQQSWIAEALGVSESAVSHWLKRARQPGATPAENLAKRTPPGRSARLSKEQKAQLPALLQRGAEAFGFRGDVWTRARVRQVIKQEFGVTYHLGHISRLLAQTGWSRQKPAHSAPQRNEEILNAWRDDWRSALKKGV